MTATNLPFSDDFVPRLRTDIDFRTYGNEAIAWSDAAAAPVLLDPVASIVYQIVDGEGSVGDLTGDVVAVVDVADEAASLQVQRSLVVMEGGGLLESSSPPAPTDSVGLDLFPFPPSA